MECPPFLCVWRAYLGLQVWGCKIHKYVCFSKSGSFTAVRFRKSRKHSKVLICNFFHRPSVKSNRVCSVMMGAATP